MGSRGSLLSGRTALRFDSVDVKPRSASGCACSNALRSCNTLVVFRQPVTAYALVKPATVLALRAVIDPLFVAGAIASPVPSGAWPTGKLKSGCKDDTSRIT